MSKKPRKRRGRRAEPCKGIITSKTTSELPVRPCKAYAITADGYCHACAQTWQRQQLLRRLLVPNWADIIAAAAPLPKGKGRGRPRSVVRVAQDAPAAVDLATQPKPPPAQPKPEPRPEPEPPPAAAPEPEQLDRRELRRRSREALRAIRRQR